MRFDRTSRRQFLTGVGGAALSVPLLPSLLPRTCAAAPAPARRFVAVTCINGSVDKAFHPSAEATTPVADGVFARKLSDIPGPVSQIIGAAFDPVRSKISVLRGLDGLSGATNHDRKGGPLTGAPLAAPNGMPTFGYSVDAVLEESRIVYPTEPKIRALRLSPHPQPSDRTFSYTSRSGACQRLRADWSDVAVFGALFGGGTPAPRPQPGVKDRRLRIIDAVLQDYKAVLGGTRIGAADRITLQNYADLVSELQRRLEVPGSPPASCAAPRPASPASSAEAMYSNHIDLVVAALACRLTSVVTLDIRHHSSNPTALASSGGPPGSNHAESHAQSALFVQYQTWIAQRVAELMRKLDSFPDGDGRTVLDNSLVYWGSDMAEGAQHTMGNMPVLVGGGLGGRLQTGYYVDYRRRPFVLSSDQWRKYPLGRPYNELLVTILQAMGLAPADYEKFGKPGFGDYTNLPAADLQVLQRFINDKRSPLPFFFRG